MVDKKTVEYVAKLARINITSEQKEFLRDQLSKILDYIDKLKEVDVDGVSPMRGLHIKKNIFREDKKHPFEDREIILENAPLREKDYFKIPKVIDREDNG